MVEKGENSVLRFADDRGVLCDLETISAYNSAYELFENETLFLCGEQDDFLSFLRCVDDWESYKYFCVNGEYVVLSDGINGDVLSVLNIASMFCETKRYYEESEVNAE